MKLPGYHEDLHVLHVNTLPNRAYYVPYSHMEAARRDVRQESDRFTSLNGEWNFRYFDSPMDVPEDCLTDDAPADVISVPSATSASASGNGIFISVTVLELGVTDVPVRYYVSTNALPGGLLANPVYRTSSIVMRRIDAKDVTWTMGRDTDAFSVTLTDDYYIGVFELTQDSISR